MTADTRSRSSMRSRRLDAAAANDPTSCSPIAATTPNTFVSRFASAASNRGSSRHDRAAAAALATRRHPSAGGSNAPTLGSTTTAGSRPAGNDDPSSTSPSLNSHSPSSSADDSKAHFESSSWFERKHGSSAVAAGAQAGVAGAETEGVERLALALPLHAVGDVLGQGRPVLEAVARAT